MPRVDLGNTPFKYGPSKQEIYETVAASGDQAHGIWIKTIADRPEDKGPLYQKEFLDWHTRGSTEDKQQGKRSRLVKLVLEI